ncbi:MAG: hypothetical protein B7733_25295 [Myxococcales bacterium FL481]|nr:MAG: hypothetical protein B7733_25295 [Myxococcales bacterium FL481]
MSSKSDPLSLVGTTVADKYDVKDIVGEGGFSVVYRAMHRIWGQPVALKCFTALARAPERLREALIESFVREGKLMAQLSSETAAIVQARDIGSMVLPDGRWIPYLVLEWLEGRPLSDVVDDELAAGQPARDLQRSLELLAGPIDALARAHERGIAHLDIKPDNLFVCADGTRTKILDFGVAKIMDARNGAVVDPAEAEIASCTPTYAAPEQFNPKRGATGPHTDVYALALVLLELLRGGEPALDGTVEELAALSQDPSKRPTPRALGLEVTDEVESVFARALAVEPRDRYRDIGQFYAALYAALKLDDSALPAPLSRPPAASRFGRPDTLRHTGSGLRMPSLTPQALSAAVETSAVDQSSAGALGRATAARVEPTPATMRGATGPGSPSESEVERGTGDDLAPEDELDMYDDEFSPRSKTSKRLVVGAALLGAGGVAYALLGGPNLGNQGPSEGDAAMASALPTQTEQPAVAATPPSPCPDGMAYVEGGKFFMGTDAKDAVFKSARPAHQVEVAPFCMDIHEVTIGAFRACSEPGECKRAFRESTWPQGSTSKKDWQAQQVAYSKLCNENFRNRERHPVNCVTWQQADAYCRFVGKRLPFEREWEFAARGSDGRVYPWGDAVPDHLRQNGCGVECVRWREQQGLPPTPTLHEQDDGFTGTSPVGHFAAGKTAHGLYDMIGNVFEWTADEYLLYGETPKPGSTKRVIRGGAFNSFMPTFADPALRFGQDADAHPHAIGFRCAADPRAVPAAGSEAAAGAPGTAAPAADAG